VNPDSKINYRLRLKAQEKGDGIEVLNSIYKWFMRVAALLFLVLMIVVMVKACSIRNNIDMDVIREIIGSAAP